MIRLIFFLLLIGTLFLGCAKAPHGIGGQPLQQLTHLGSSQVFAGSSDSAHVAYVRNGLYLLDLKTGHRSTLSENSPITLSWSPKNKVLAAVFKDASEGSRLVQYSSDGQVLVDTVLPITVIRLAWSVRGDLLVVGYKLQSYSFGGNLQQHLYRFNGSDVAKTKLDDVTLKPRTVKLLTNNLSRVLPVHFTVYGDEFYFVRLHDPPEFKAYLDVVWKSWQGGEGKTVLTLPLQEIRFAPGLNEDSVVVVQKHKRTAVDAWSRPLDASGGASSYYHFSNGQLFDGEKMIADWGEGARLQILNGDKFLLAVDNNLYLGSDLNAKVRQSYSERKWNLRRWRASGLISPQEYLDELKEF